MVQKHTVLAGQEKYITLQLCMPFETTGRFVVFCAVLRKNEIFLTEMLLPSENEPAILI